MTQGYQFELIPAPPDPREVDALADVMAHPPILPEKPIAERNVS